MGGKGSGGARPGSGAKRKPRVERQCPNCGATFLCLESSTQRFCSKPCVLASQSARTKGTKLAWWHGKTKPCTWCGRDFALTSSAKAAALYCGRPCLLASAQTRMTKYFNTPDSHVCVECGCQFPHKKSGRTKHLYCTRKCAAVARGRRAAEARTQCPTPPRPSQVCAVCGETFDAPRTRRTCWSEACRLEQKKRDYRVSMAKRKCRVCGVIYLPTRCGQGYCSTACSSVAQRAHRRRHKRARGSTHRKRARVAGVRCETVNVFRVFRRDGWRCYLCGCDTPQALRGALSDNAPELDHVVPISKGGAHAYDNVRCACRVCNWMKGDSLVSECLWATGGVTKLTQASI